MTLTILPSQTSGYQIPSRPRRLHNNSTNRNNSTQKGNYNQFQTPESRDKIIESSTNGCTNQFPSHDTLPSTVSTCPFRLISEQRVRHFHSQTLISGQKTLCGIVDADYRRETPIQAAERRMRYPSGILKVGVMVDGRERGSG